MEEDRQCQFISFGNFLSQKLCGEISYCFLIEQAFLREYFKRILTFYHMIDGLKSHPTAVNHEHFPRNIRRRITCQKHCRSSKFFRFRPSAHWNSLCDLLISRSIFPYPGCHIGCTISWCDPIDKDSMWRPCVRKRLSQLFYCSFGRCVCWRILSSLHISVIGLEIEP